MMDFSLLSTHESSMNIVDKTNSIMQSFEIDNAFSEYSNIIDYQHNSKVVEICTEFREITKKGSFNNDYLLMIDGYLCNLSNYMDNVVRIVGLLPKNGDKDVNLTRNIINHEIKTWRLMYKLYQDRFTTLGIKSTIAVSRCSQLELISDLFSHNKNLREAQIVVDWLEECTSETVDKNIEFLIGAHGKTWEHTKHMILRRDNIKIFGTRAQNELDPDAPLRGSLHLTDSDKNDENEYLRYLFNCLKSGDSDKAIALCQSHDEWWRALSIEGWKPFHNPLLKCDNANIDNNVDVMGNPSRDVFKSVCWQLSEDSQLNVYERAIYAIFCGNISVLSLVEKDWRGLLWAYFKIYIENVIDHHLNTFMNNGAFGTQSLFGDDDIDLGRLGLSVDIHRSRSDTLIHSSREQIFDDIATKLTHSPIDVIKSGIRPGSKTQKSFYESIFEVVQQFIIVDDIEGLLFYIELAISKLPQKRAACDKLILRFLAHVVIFIFSIHVDVKIDIYHTVLEHYIESLIDDRSLENISFYVSKLSTDLQIKWFCKCMEGVYEYSEMRRCILDGVEYDLPIIEISRLVVQSIRLESEAANVTKTFRDTLDQSVNTAFITESDKRKISGLDWLTILPQQHCHLVRHANALCRTLLEDDKLEAAKMVLSKTPRDLLAKLHDCAHMDLSPPWLEGAIYENQCLAAFVTSYDAYCDWYKHFKSQKPAEKDFTVTEDLNKLSFIEKQTIQKQFEEYDLSVKQWEKSAKYSAKKVLDLFQSTLRMGASGWLSNQGAVVDWAEDRAEMIGDNDSWESRRAQIERLQRKHVVGMCFLLMKVLVSSDQNEKCFELTDLVADEELQLHQYFEREQLQRLLQQVRQCSLHLMCDGRDSLGAQA